MMTEDEALDLLRVHSCGTEDSARWENGFLGVLRPYKNELPEHNFHEVMTCIGVLSRRLTAGDAIDRELADNLFTIVYLTYLWAVDPNGMLRSNDLLSAEAQETIRDWAETIGWAVHVLVGSHTQYPRPIAEAFANYDPPPEWREKWPPEVLAALASDGANRPPARIR